MRTQAAAFAISINDLIVIMATFYLACPLCSSRAPSLTLWMSHLRQVHESDSNISVSCPYDECTATYTKVNSICSHIYRQHKVTDSLSSTMTSSLSITSSRAAPGAVDFGEPVPPLVDLSLPDSVSHDVDLLLGRNEYEQKKKSMLFLMQLKEQRMISQAAINDVVTGCKQVFEHTVGRLRAGVSQALSEHGIDSKDVSGLHDIFDNTSDPFHGLGSVYLQEKFKWDAL